MRGKPHRVRCLRCRSRQCCRSGSAHRTQQTIPSARREVSRKVDGHRRSRFAVNSTRRTRDIHDQKIFNPRKGASARGGMKIALVYGFWISHLPKVHLIKYDLIGMSYPPKPCDESEDRYDSQRCLVVPVRGDCLSQALNHLVTLRLWSGCRLFFGRLPASLPYSRGGHLVRRSQW